MRRAAVDEVLREVGRRIRAAREAVELTQEEAAGQAGIDYKRYQRLEAGSVNATVRTLARVASALSTSFWQLVAEPRRSTRKRR